jgi:DNA-binding SARP family transcriptional activator
MTIRVQLIGSFGVCGADGRRISVRRPSARLLAYLALAGGCERRMVVASALWPDLCEERALANLRSVFWRARRELPMGFDGDSHSLWLGDDVSVDYLAALAMPIDGLDAHDLDPAVFLDELLPSWPDEWLYIPRLLYRQTRLQCIEMYVAERMRREEFDIANQLLDRLLQAEPFLESAHRLKAELLTRTGDAAGAIELCTAFDVRLRSFLSIEPSPALHRIAATWS